MSSFDKGILLLQQRCSRLQEGDPQLPRLRHELAEMLLERCRVTDNAMDDLSAAIYQEGLALEEVTSLSSIKEEDIAMLLFNLVFFRWRNSRLWHDLEAALERGIQTLTLVPQSFPQRKYLLRDIAALLCHRSPDIEDLNAALKFAEDALDLSEDDEYHANFLYEAAKIGFKIFCEDPDDSKLENVITRMLQAQTCMEKENPLQKMLHKDLMIYFIQRYNRGKDLDDLHAALKYCNQYNDLLETGPSLPEFSQRQSTVCFVRYAKSDELEHLDEAITYARDELQYIENTSELPTSLILLAELHEIRFSRRGDTRDATEGLALAKRAALMTSIDHHEHVVALRCWAMHLYNHNNEITPTRDVEELIAILTTSLSSSIFDNDDRANLLTMLGVALAQRFRTSGSLRDIETAIQRAKEALKLLPNRKQRFETLDLLSNMLHEHVEVTGDDCSINEAVARSRECLEYMPEDYVDRVSDRGRIMVSYARQLANRCLRSGNTSEIDEAISIYEQVNETLPEDDFLRVRNSDALAALYSTRFGRTHLIQDIEAAINVLSENVEKARTGSQERALKLFNLGSCLSKRFFMTNCLLDLKAAIRAYHDALSTPFNKPNATSEARCLISVSTNYESLYELTHDSSQLVKSLKANATAIGMLPDSHPDLAKAHLRIGRTLEIDIATSHSHLIEGDALHHYLIACQMPSGLPEVRLDAAHRAMLILGERGNWAEGARVASIGIDLMKRVCSRKLSRQDQAQALRSALGVASDACAISLRLGDSAVSEALQHVEFGRGLILGNIIDGQSDLTKLEEQDTSLAKRYARLRSIASVATTQLEDKYRELENCEEDIRRIQGFENFLRPPSAKELMDSASDGPIVIVNFSRIAADAIIVSKSGLQAVSLHSMSWRDSEELTATFSSRKGIRDAEAESPPSFGAEFLGWLWSTCVNPVLQRILPDFDPISESIKAPRIWWIGTGAASQFPFHAATNYQELPPVSTLDFVISSYTSTIKALENARYQAKIGQAQSGGDEKSLLIITMPKTPGNTSLPGVTRERRAIQRMTEQNYNVTNLEQPDVEQALGHINKSQIVHFACHGSSDPIDPLQSHLLLQKSTNQIAQLDRLTVESLLTTNTRKRAWIAYLSACSTAQNGCGQLMDESLHLTSAFQMAGFAHVIGSMWPVDDSVSIEVARKFYQSLSNSTGDKTMANRAVPEALRDAMLAIRRQYPESANLWAPYLHYGA